MEHVWKIKLKEEVVDRGVMVSVLNATVISVDNPKLNCLVMQNEQGRDTEISEKLNFVNRCPSLHAYCQN